LSWFFSFYDWLSLKPLKIFLFTDEQTKNLHRVGHEFLLMGKLNNGKPHEICLKKTRNPALMKS